MIYVDLQIVFIFQFTRCMSMGSHIKDIDEMDHRLWKSSRGKQD